MEIQMSLFDTVPQITETPAREPGKVIPFPGIQETQPPKPTNYRKGGEQTVFPIKKQEELEAMANWLHKNANRKYLLGFILGINLGLRANELLTLKPADLFHEDHTVRYSLDFSDTSDQYSLYQKKVNKRRRFFLNEACVSALTWYYHGDFSKAYKHEYIFYSREGGHIEVDTFRKKLKDAATACGIRQNIGTHTLRKTFGYMHYMRNKDIVFLQRLFGHSSALITMRYIGIAEEEEKRAYHSVSINLLDSLPVEADSDIESTTGQ